MIETNKREAIFLLHQEGMSLREIARRLHVSRNTVREIIAQEGAMPQTVRKDKQQIDPELLRALYEQCQGYVQRVQEKLREEEAIEVGYSTLSRMLREAGISKAAKGRCHRVPDEPGAEMQHDTTVYTIRFAEKTHKIVASLLYLRYSKRRYLKFYRAFNRFAMKCFLHEALSHWGYAAKVCIIDNTNLARLRGTGAAAVMVPEMEAFARQYGFAFLCHEKGHSNRKAGEERSFWFVETNFLPGRSFQSLEDLNHQAKEWATLRLEHRPQGKGRLIPTEAFEHERASLLALPPHLPAPYQSHQRSTDQYGYIAFAGNYYWVPGSGRDEVRVLQYADYLKIYRKRQCLAHYALPADGIKNAQFSPEGMSKPPHAPKNRRRPSQEEEKRLRALGPEVEAYLDWVLPNKGQGRHHFLRALLALSRKMTAPLFLQSIRRAAKYRIDELPVIERIALLHLQEGSATLPTVLLEEDFTQRETYQEGSLTEAPDLSIYREEDDEAPIDAENADTDTSAEDPEF